ncbi:PLP-dependent aminotransferase family protein [Gallibacterium trehalosifermentans]|uniref:PLP-dependent aminotransferase family protein n=1 Tax=Gallibacterium trehalosifermentans TaxID=516935 RepID=A0ABV6H3A4_9PAST
MKYLAYQLDKSLPQPLYLQLYQQIKNAIHQGKLTQGEALPSKRQLCDYLKISQNTVENSYAQLLAEGYIESKPRVGYFVSTQLLPPELSTNGVRHSLIKSNTKIWRYDFNPNVIDTQHFPFERWKKIQKRLFSKKYAHLLALGDRQGEEDLRIQIAEYLRSARGVECLPEQIVINAGIELCLIQLMLLWQHCYPQQQAHYAMEELGYWVVERLWQSYGQLVTKLPIDNQSLKIDLTELAKQEVDFVYITPSHQYPFGSVLTINERQRLLTWVNQQPQRYLIEDDYDSEFRYQGKPIPALKSLDQHDKVVYLGSFSKVMMPSIRVSFMVLPEKLLSYYQQHISFFHSSVSRVDQQILATFMQTGEFEKHINRMRKQYRRKMELLCQILKQYPHKIRFFGESSGFYLLIELLNETRTIVELTKLAEQQQIKVYPIDFHRRILFVLGFGNLREVELLTGLESLFDCWGIKKPTQ